MNRKHSFADRLLRLVKPPDDLIDPVPGQRLRLSGRGVRIPVPDRPVEVELGEERLHIQKDVRLDGADGAGPPDLIVFNPDRYFSGIGYSISLQSGHTLQISHEAADQTYLFSRPREAFRRHFQLDYDGDSLVFRDPISELGTHVTLLENQVQDSAVVRRRRLALMRLTDVFGGDVDVLSPDRAMDVIQHVNEALLADPYRRLDNRGNVGGVVELPPEPIPVVVGDLHANVDNLLKLLCEGALLQSLEDNTAILIFLGDIAHPDQDPLDDMDSSVLTMDLLFMLKLRFPAGVFFLRGNHESFSADLGKGGVPQALLWQKRLTELRGNDYCLQMARFYKLSPLLALSPDFVACHAGPPRSRTSLDEIVNVRRNPTLAHELMWNRVRRPNYPHGYTARDVRRFRKSLGLASHLPFLVGHCPYADEGTVWLDVGGIPHHHIVYSAKPDRIGAFTRIDGHMVPRAFSAEPLLATSSLDLESVGERAE